MKALRRFLLTALFLMIATATAQAGDWIKLHEQDGITYYINTDVTQDYDGYTVWIKEEYTTKAARAKIIKDYSLKRTAYSQVCCNKYKKSWDERACKAIVFYSANGTVVESFNYPYLEYIMVIPDSLGYVWAEVAKMIWEAKQ